MAKITIGIIGKGNIGSELYRKAIVRGWKVAWAMDDTGIFTDLTCSKKIGEPRDYASHLDGLDVVFLAIPTMDQGETAFQYANSVINAGIPVVTCEKGALSNYFQELEGAVRGGKLGYSATVGGGSRILRYLEERMGPQVQEVHAVVNGTLNYVFEGLSKGRSLGEVVEETKKLGYAEPGAKHPLEVINKEATGDVPMKAAILFNVCNLTEKRVRAREIAVQHIELGQLKRLVRESANRRYIVSITKDRNDEENVIWGFKHTVGGWHISAGFKHMNDNPLFRELIPSGVNNAILTSEGEFGKDGSYVLTGPGAGAGPTASSMMMDAERLIASR
jgi:homoserine dehydrogenase